MHCLFLTNVKIQSSWKRFAEKECLGKVERCDKVLFFVSFFNPAHSCQPLPLVSASGDYETYDEALKAELPDKTITLKSIATNLIDKIWAEQPIYNVDTVITILDADKYTGNVLTEEMFWHRKACHSSADALNVCIIKVLALPLNLICGFHSFEEMKWIQWMELLTAFWFAVTRLLKYNHP